MTTDDELLALAEAATPGPWRTFRNRHTTTDGYEWGWVAPSQNSRSTINGMSIVWERPEGETNARFLAAASPDRVKALIEEKRDLDRLFDLRWKADMRAVKRWRDAAPAGEDRSLTMPDRADMGVFLLERLKRAETFIEKVRRTSTDGPIRRDAAAYFNPAGEGE